MSIFKVFKSLRIVSKYSRKYRRRANFSKRRKFKAYFKKRGQFLSSKGVLFKQQKLFIYPFKSRLLNTQRWSSSVHTARFSPAMSRDGAYLNRITALSQKFKNKVNAGANSAITQFFFNADAYFRFMDECLIADINIPIVPGVMPIYNIKQLARFASNCGAEIPRWLRIKLESYGDDLPSLRSYGVDVVSELCETLIGWDVPSLHFYTLNQAGIITRIIQNIESS